MLTNDGMQTHATISRSIYVFSPQPGNDVSQHKKMLVWLYAIVWKAESTFIIPIVDFNKSTFSGPVLLISRITLLISIISIFDNINY